MNDQIAPPVGADMHAIAREGDAAELRAAIIAHRLVVIAGDIDQVAAFAHLAQQLLQHVVMRLRPIDAALDAPEIDDVADQIDAGGFVAAEEIEEGFGLAGLGAEMDVRDEQCAVTPHPWLMQHVVFAPRMLQHDEAELK